MSQELTDAERLRNLVQYVIDPPALGEAVYITKEDAEFVRSIADRLERPGVLNRDAKLEYNPTTYTGSVRVMIEGMPFSMATGVEPVDGLPVKVSVTPAAT